MALESLVLTIMNGTANVMVAWTNVVVESAKLPIDIWSTIFDAVTG